MHNIFKKNGMSAKTVAKTYMHIKLQVQHE